MIYNLDILLPLDTLGVLPVLLFLVSGSTPGRLIFCQWEYSYKSIQIVHLFLEVPSTNKMRVAREPRATGDFKKVARGKKSRVSGSYSRENITWVKTLRACITHNKA